MNQQLRLSIHRQGKRAKARDTYLTDLEHRQATYGYQADEHAATVDRLAAACDRLAAAIQETSDQFITRSQCGCITRHRLSIYQPVAIAVCRRHQ